MNYLHQRLDTVAEPQIHELAFEIAQVKQVPPASYLDKFVFSILTLSQKHPWTGKPESLKAKNRPKGSLLKTRVKDLRGSPVHDLAIELCRYHKVSDEFIDAMQYYVFLNRIMNEKSELRRPPAFIL